MWNSKTKAFTLLELLVALLLSGIVATIVLGCLTLLLQRHGIAEQEQRVQMQVPLLRSALAKDVKAANVVWLTPGGFACRSDSSLIFYEFNRHYLLRRYEGHVLATDTFLLDTGERRFSWGDAEPATASSPIDSGVFTLKGGKHFYTFSFKKFYDAATMMQLHNQK